MDEFAVAGQKKPRLRGFTCAESVNSSDLGRQTFGQIQSINGAIARITEIISQTGALFTKFAVEGNMNADVTH